MIVAPFAKAEVFRAVLGACGDGVEVCCITRWRPEEIARGVSDLEVHQLVEARPNTTLRLCHNLHAKLYQADDDCLVGSANISGAGFGWSSHPSLELLVGVPSTEPTVRAFLKKALAMSVPASEQLRQEMAHLAQEFTDEWPAPPPPNARAREPQPEPTLWLPWCRSAPELFMVYVGSWTEVTKSATEDAFRDLEFLEIPAGLAADEFQLVVRSRLLVHPIFSAAREEGLGGITMDDMEKLGIDSSAYSGPDEVRAMVAEWIHHFF